MAYFFLTLAAIICPFSPVVAIANIILAAACIMIDHAELRSLEQHASRMRAIADRDLSYRTHFDNGRRFTQATIAHGWEKANEMFPNRHAK